MAILRLDQKDGDLFLAHKLGRVNPCLLNTSPFYTSPNFKSWIDAQENLSCIGRLDVFMAICFGKLYSFKSILTSCLQRVSTLVNGIISVELCWQN